MSAGNSTLAATVTRDPAMLAPKFRIAVDAAIAECRANFRDAYVYETYRTPELQALYFERGRTIIPPARPVTNAASNLYSWHGFGLAVDVISLSKGWGESEAWFQAVAEIFKKHGCKWGGDWKARDLPHFQWGKCKPSPSDQARQLLKDGGFEAVWRAVDAL